jgi:hypothetical protein
MPSFRHNDVEIAYLDEGEGKPIVLIIRTATSVPPPAGKQTITVIRRSGYSARALPSEIVADAAMAISIAMSSFPRKARWHVDLRVVHSLGYRPRGLIRWSRRVSRGKHQCNLGMCVPKTSSGDEFGIGR